MDIRPWNFHAPEVPPPEEVQIERTYDYVPCPMSIDPSGLNDEKLHSLFKTGQHFDRFWLDFFPKRLKDELQYTRSRPEVNMSWGIHIVEGVNWERVSMLSLVLYLMGTVFAIVYIAITHDTGGGFSMGAFLSALPGLGILVLQLKTAV
jgi:hypothetical protein